MVTPPTEIDASNASELAVALASEQSTDVVVDCSGITFIDSSGLAVIARASNTLGTAGRSLVLDRPSVVLRRALQLTDMEGLLG